MSGGASREGAVEPSRDDLLTIADTIEHIGIESLTYETTGPDRRPRLSFTESLRFASVIIETWEALRPTAPAKEHSSPSS